MQKKTSIWFLFTSLWFDSDFESIRFDLDSYKVQYMTNFLREKKITNAVIVVTLL